eukprot:765287-Hanusia_phi.AAC.1
MLSPPLLSSPLPSSPLLSTCGSSGPITCEHRLNLERAICRLVTCQPCSHASPQSASGSQQGFPPQTQAESLEKPCDARAAKQYGGQEPRQTAKTSRHAGGKTRNHEQGQREVENERSEKKKEL